MNYLYIVVSRNVINILLYVAELCKRYFPARDIPAMLELFLPLLTKEVCTLIYSFAVFSKSLTI
jgi:hypothetical protein